MAAYTKCTAGIGPMMDAINTGTGSFKVALSNADPTAKTTFTAGTDDLTTANGYTAGGNACTVSSHATTAGTYKLVLASPAVWTATGAVGPFRYAILWETSGSGTPIGFWDYGSSISMANTDTFTVTLDGTNGVFTVT